jgi:DNA-binding CsgD family transcriptional regulator
MAGRRWTPEEEQIVEDMLGAHTSVAIARRLGVSVHRVNNLLSRRGWSRRRVGVLSRHEVARILGSQDNTFLRRIVADGTLPARRLPGRGRFGVYEIREDDLVAFLRANPHLVDRDAVDAGYRQYVGERWLTLPEAFARGAAHVISLEHACLAGTIPEARKRGIRWVIPDTILARLREGRRRWTTDVEHRRQLLAYQRLQRRGRLHGRVGRTLWRQRDRRSAA